MLALLAVAEDFEAHLARAPGRDASGMELVIHNDNANVVEVLRDPAGVRMPTEEHGSQLRMLAEWTRRYCAMMKARYRIRSITFLRETALTEVHRLALDTLQTNRDYWFRQYGNQNDRLNPGDPYWSHRLPLDLIIEFRASSLAFGDYRRARGQPHRNNCWEHMFFFRDLGGKIRVVFGTLL